MATGRTRSSLSVETVRSTSTFSDTINRIVLRIACVESREESSGKANGNNEAGPLSAVELAELSMLCAQQSQRPSEGFCTVEGDQLLALLELLDRHINNAVGLNFVQAAVDCCSKEAPGSVVSSVLDSWLRGPGQVLLDCLSGALDAASIIVVIASSPGVDPRVVNEDAIEACISLMRHHLKSHIIPSINQTGHLLVCDNEPPAKKRRSVESGLSKDIKKVYKQVLSTTKLQLGLMERFEGLVRNLSMDDQQILLLTNTVIAALELDGSQPLAIQLQLASIAVLKEAFRKYPLHRESFVEDLFPIMLKLPTGKRSLRCFPLRYSSFSSPQMLSAVNEVVVGKIINKSHFIQVTSALIVELVHSCVNRPSYESVGDETRWHSGLDQCHSVADFFADQLLKRCASTTPGASEFRPTLLVLVEDWLMMYLVPEFPAAELLLYSLQQRLYHEIGQATPSLRNRQSKPPEASFLSIACDVVGKITAVQARISAYQRSRDMVFSYEIVDARQRRMACYCGAGSFEDKRFRVGCNRCHKFFHGTCMGIADSESVPSGWFCDSCLLQNIQDREQSRYPQAQHVIDLEYTIRHSYQSQLAHRLGVEGLDHAKQFHFARWLDELEGRCTASGVTKQPHQIMNELSEFWEKPGPSGEFLSNEGGIRSILFVAAKTSQLAKSFRKQIMVILKFLSDESSHSLRKLSLKALEKIVEGDPDLMMLPIITKQVSGRLSDDSISVREAALSLVGSYVVHSPSVANAFHSAIIARLADSGISVRKRAIKIFESILLSNPDYKGRSGALDVMLQRACDPKEEDNVRDLIESFFVRLWMHDGSVDGYTVDLPQLGLESPGDATPPAKPLSSPEAGVVTPTPPVSKKRSGSKNPFLRTRLVAEQMVDIVSTSGTTAHLNSLLRKYFGVHPDGRNNNHGKSDDIDPRNCEKIVNALFEYLIMIEEERSRITNFGRTLVATLRTICIFAEISAMYVLPNMDAVLPYLKADNALSNEEESLVVAAVCDILWRLAEVFRHEVTNRLAATSVSKDMTRITYKFGPFTLNSAIRLFAKLAHEDESIFSRRLLDLAKTFYTFLAKRISINDFNKTDEKTRNNVHRALSVLGSICQFQMSDLATSSWDAELARINAELVEPEHLDWSNMLLACYRMFDYFLQKTDSQTKCTALRALGCIFVSQPRLVLYLHEEGMIEELMSADAGVALQLESLQCWSKILRAEETRIASAQEKVEAQSSEDIALSKRISGDQDGDATIFGGVLTNHADRVFDLTKHTDKGIRFAALEVIGLLLRQGLVNPNDAVPHLFALQGDVENDNIRSLALQLLIIEGEKRPDTLRRRITAGVKHAYEFQRIAYKRGEKQISAIVLRGNGKQSIPDCVFSSVFQECIAENRKQRHGFFKNILSLFKRKNSKTDGDGDSREYDLHLLSFVSQMLAHLQYKAVDDPLFIIYEVSSLVMLQGSEILDEMTALLRHVELSSNDHLDDDISKPDALEKAALSKFPSRTAEAHPLSSPNFDLQRFAWLCEAGIAMVIALRLKSFLQTAYNLSEIRCLEFNPSSNDRTCDKGPPPKPNYSKHFGIAIPLVRHSNGRVDKDALIRQYAHFREMMRKDSSSDSFLNADDDDGELQPTRVTALPDS